MTGRAMAAAVASSPAIAPGRSRTAASSAAWLAPCGARVRRSTSAVAGGTASPELERRRGPAAWAPRVAAPSDGAAADGGRVGEDREPLGATLLRAANAACRRSYSMTVGTQLLQALAGLRAHGSSSSDATFLLRQAPRAS